MNVDSIQNGYVLDHIQAGMAMKIYSALNLDELSCSVAVLKNVSSGKMGKKDIIKIDELIDLNLDVLGYIAPDITVNVIKDGRLIEKCSPELPLEIVDIIKCKNPRCITSVEQELPQIFVLTDRQERTYRCKYCESRAKN